MITAVSKESLKLEPDFTAWRRAKKGIRRFENTSALGGRLALTQTWCLEISLHPTVYVILWPLLRKARWSDCNGLFCPSNVWIFYDLRTGSWQNQTPAILSLIVTVGSAKIWVWVPFPPTPSLESCCLQLHIKHQHESSDIQTEAHTSTTSQRQIKQLLQCLNVGSHCSVQGVWDGSTGYEEPGWVRWCHLYLWWPLLSAGVRI